MKLNLKFYKIVIIYKNFNYLMEYMFHNIVACIKYVQTALQELSIYYSYIIVTHIYIYICVYVCVLKSSQYN